METTIVYWGYIWGNGKENGNYYLYHARMGVPVIKGWEV